MKIKQSILICIGMALLLMTIGTAAAAATITVNDSTGPVANFTSIQAAIDDVNTTDGDTILVYPGTYIENVDVDKELTIISESGDPEDTIVQAANSNDHVFSINADNVIISEFKVTDAASSGNAGIYLNNVEDCTVTENSLSDNYYGIWLDYSSNNIVSNNTVNSNNYGIRLYRSNNNNMLIDNTANFNNNYGIWLDRSSNNILSNNTLNWNDAYGIYQYDSKNNIMSNNTLDSNSYGIYLTSSSHNELNNNTAEWNDFTGIYLSSSDNNELNNNNANSNTNGIYLSSSDNNELNNNTADWNDMYGINLYISSNNELINNTAYSNDYGIRLYASSNYNLIYNNYLDNTNNVQDSGTNTWSSTEMLTYIYNGNNYVNYTGNYYSDYEGADNNDDGIGDTPYGDDNYPLLFWPVTSEIPVAKPVITLLDPSPSSVSDNAGDSRTFTVIIDQIANVTWMLDWFTLYTNVSVQTASYHNSSAKVGVHNLTVIAQNDNGTDQKSWTWTVEQLIDTTEPVVIVNTPIDLWVNNGTVLYLNATITDVIAGVKNATVNVSGINDTINTAVLTNTADNYWTNDSIIVNTSNSGLQNLTITAYNNADNVSNSVGFTLKVDNILPVIQNAYATPSTIEANGIDDALLNVTATDADSNISSVSVNLSAIGGSPAQAMTNNNGTWQLIVNTTILGTFDLPVNVIDHAGNSNTSVSILLNASEVVPEDIHLHQGWNFISVPYELRNSSVDSVLADVDYDDMAYYNTEMDIWENVSTIEPLKGYWIFVYEDSIIPQSVLDPKLPVLPQKIQLYEGWNSIGYTDSNQPLSAEVTLRSINDSYVSILGPWNPVTMSFEYVGHNGETGIISGNHVGTDVFKMEPYKGYWLYVTDECTLTIIGF
ncbi:NosD domain-containing protein [Methanococcoides methylutens]|uniref:NosD domain-containing protein n=1 Tax=Methanococcoides methylutens TaxID=2226 RepID=UPI004043E18F